MTKKTKKERLQYIIRRIDYITNLVTRMKVAIKQRLSDKALIEKELLKIESSIPKDGWSCWKCRNPNIYSDVRTQVERHETCIHVCGLLW